MHNGGRKFFTILFIIIILIVVGLIGYLIYDYLNNYFMNKEAEQAVQEFEEYFDVSNIGDEQPIEEPDEEPQDEEPTTTTKKKNTTTTYKGYTMIGTIHIPKTNIRYPIVDKITTKSMTVAVAYLYGPGLNQIGNTVIVGHNYRNKSFFSNNKKLSEGDRIYITDATGEAFEYKVYEKYETSDTDFEYATRDTNGKREISLSTCTQDPKVRLVIWAKEV